MQLDSHRQPLSLNQVRNSQPAVPISTRSQIVTTPTSANMRCPRSRCPMPKTFTTEDGVEMQTWHSIRRENIRNMRSMVKRVLLYMALIEAIRVGPDAMVFAGTRDFPKPGFEDYGIAYYAGYILSYIYLCAFTIVWKPLFSWWTPTSIPSDSDTAENVDRIASIMTQVNMVLLPLSIALSLIEYTYWAFSTLIYVDARPLESSQLPKNTQKNWLARLMLLAGILTSTTLGYGVFETLAEYHLAHVKSLEYCIIVVPVQINLGILLGSAMQWRMEQRQEKKQMAIRAIEVGTGDEKQALLAV